MKKLLYLLALSFATLGFSQAATNTATVGQTVTLTATADGTQPFTYQWYKNGVIWPGTVQQVVTFTSVQLFDAGSYTVDVINSAGHSMSPPVVFTVTAPVVPPTNAAASFSKK